MPVTTFDALSRRRLLGGAAAGGLLLALGPSALAATPKRGGHARYGVRGGSTSDTLDPATWPDVFMRTLGYSYCNTLTEVAPDNSLQPELVESWSAEPGATAWTFKLRPGITFHNGKSFGADDVMATINHHRGPDSTSGMKKLLSAITEMRKDDDLTVRFTLVSGDADFPFIFADYRMVMMPATPEGGIDWRAGVGTGGYSIKSFEPGVRAEVERNPNYWRSDRAFFDSAEIITVPDVTARQNALMTGSLDIIDQVDLKTVNHLQRAPGVVIGETAGGLHYTYAMNSAIAPFANNDVRLALKYGVDREALLQKVLRGYGTLGNDQPISSTTPYYDPNIPQRTYDPDRARHHLKKAGMEDLSLDISVSDFLYAGAVDGVTLYKEQAAPAGIDLTIVREPSDGYFSNVWRKKPFIASYWSPRPTAGIMFATAYASEAPWNDTYWNNERFDQLLVAARAELNEDKRSEIYGEMQRLVRDEGGAVVPLFANNVFAHSDKVATPTQMAGNWELDGGRSIERWWFA
ncbi:MAG: ABC transporter substrate-binding protein [Pseudomonadota bacterium]